MWARLRDFIRRLLWRPKVPYGISSEQWKDLSTCIRARVGDWSDDVRAHGSRVSGTHRADSDLDIAIRVSAAKFDEVVRSCFGTPKPGSAKERTMQHARESGKIQSGEAGLRSLRRELESVLNLPIDLSVIRIGGPFDRGPYLSLIEN
jgi:Nucleotidyltransferase domain